MLFVVSRKIVKPGIAQGLCNIGKTSVVAFEHLLGFLDTQLARIRDGRYAHGLGKQLSEIPSRFGPAVNRKKPTEHFSSPSVFVFMLAPL